MDSTSTGWNRASPAYTMVERITVPLCQCLVALTHKEKPLDEPNATAFDNGCGSAVLTAALKAQFPALPILASDVSPSMIDLLKSKIVHFGWKTMDVRVLDSRRLKGIASEPFSRVSGSVWRQIPMMQ